MVQDQIAILYRMIYEKESKKLKATAWWKMKNNNF